ncbi:beta-glucoside-specific PTS transporter subunit IIABC [Paenibacillus massiliensis]|uniref:beta-glucoside-specific PTS transporter subunit IIABC n=1 Tax=Paenibacillus massiliensis TaxID=225917 RepID=UPI000365D15D|nr:beta-glucoside-specific PTS transporter subunit IIABC [Paenibacillus massiliensis]
MGKFTELSNRIVEHVGGEENVVELYHCMTRLRFKLKDFAKADKQQLEQLDGVITVVQGNGQYQVVIGNDVHAVYKEIIAQHDIKAAGEAKEEAKGEKSGNLITRFFNTMSGIMTPIVPALAGAGMLKAVLVILSTTLEVLSQDSSTYKILAAAGNSVFYFLPLLLAISTARHFGANMFVSLTIMGALLEPNFTGLMKSIGDVTSFIGIPVVLMSYTGTLIPAMLTIWVFSYLERYLKKIIPANIQMFAVPLLSLMIMVPLAAAAVGPVGVYLGNGIASGINYLSSSNGLIMGALIGGGWTLLVMFGLHWGIVPAMLNNLSLHGFDTIKPPSAAATFASSGAALGVFLKAKDKKLKAYALSALMPSILAGVTEPIVYGISVKLKRPLIAQIIGGVIGGAFIGAFHSTVLAYVFPAVTTLPAFATDTFVYFLIGITAAFVITAVLTYIFGFEEQVEVAPSGRSKAETVQQQASSTPAADTQETGVSAPVSGQVIPLQEVSDPVFSSGAMGDGVAILPEEGKVYAPVAGTVTSIAKSKHAIGITADDGFEILIHVGLNTVKLKGAPFELKVTEQQQVREGELLMEFDLEAIRQAGLELTTPVIVTNLNTFHRVETTAKRQVLYREPLLKLHE